MFDRCEACGYQARKEAFGKHSGRVSPRRSPAEGLSSENRPERFGEGVLRECPMCGNRRLEWIQKYGGRDAKARGMKPSGGCRLTILYDYGCPPEMKAFADFDSVVAARQRSGALPGGWTYYIGPRRVGESAFKKHLRKRRSAKRKSLSN